MDSFYSAVFLLLEGSADGIGAGLGVVRSYGDLLGGTICVAGMINAVLYVTLDPFVVLTAILIIHFYFPPLLGILHLLLPEGRAIIQKFKF